MTGRRAAFVPETGSSMVPAGLDATLVLLRHGETTYIAEGRFQGQQEAPLSPLGLRQAELAAERLAHPSEVNPLPIPPGPPVAIVHSPLQRTTQVATRVRDALAATGAAPPIVVEPGLAEIAQGQWEGVPHTEIRARWRHLLAAWRRTPTLANAPGGEQLVDVQGRVEPAIRRILALLEAAGPPGGVDRSPVPGYQEAAMPPVPWAVLVGHDGIFKVVLLTLLDLPLERFWVFPFALGGISVVDIRGGRATLRAHNLTGHLAPLYTDGSIPESGDRQRSGAL